MNNTVSPIKKDQISRGAQIAYIPDHLVKKFFDEHGAVTLNDVFSNISDLSGVELGFVTSWSESFVFCRFFYTGTRNIKNKDTSIPMMWRNVFPIIHTSTNYINEWLQTNPVAK